MSDLAVANEIRRQLGSQAFALLGASQLVGGENFLQFSIRGCRKINKIRIELDANDTYTVSFWHIGRGGANVQKIAECDGVCCDMLHDVIELETRLYTTFHARR